MRLALLGCSQVRIDKCAMIVAKHDDCACLFFLFQSVRTKLINAVFACLPISQ